MSTDNRQIWITLPYLQEILYLLSSMIFQKSQLYYK